MLAWAQSAFQVSERRACRGLAIAVRLLSRGVGIKAIGDVLGHRSFESTQVYLRLETDMLRAVALPVPRSSLAERRA